MQIEKTILRNLIQNEEYSRKILPFLKDEYFTVVEDRALFSEIRDFIVKFNVAPTLDALSVEINKLANLSDMQVKILQEVLKDFKGNTDVDNDQWLIESTEEFCQDKAIYLGLMQSIEIANSNKGSLSKGAIPQIMTDAVGVTFSTNIGHEYLEQFEDRYEFYHQKLERLPFDLEFFNKITGGGLPKKTLNILLSGTGGGKSLAMCHISAAAMSMGKNVLYITLELAEERVAERIDANLMNVTMDELKDLPYDTYMRLAKNVKNKATGKLIIEEYPTAAASVIHFKALLNELRLKKNFVPDLLCVDYLNICMSARVKPGANINSYMYVKAIAEELRGLAVEFNIPVLSATQTTRSGFNNSDPGLEDTSESFGLPATADFMVALIATDDLNALNQIMVKQLKSRYGDITKNKKFVIGIDRAKMRLYDVDASAQKDIDDSGQVEPTKANKYSGIKVPF